MDQILNKENTGVHLPTNPIKNGVPTNSVKKKTVLGKLDNVMHQTPGITPFKSHHVKPEGSIAKLSIRKTHNPNIKNKDREDTNVKANCFLGSYMLKREAHVINLFNYTDFPSEKCLRTCSRPITETWSDQAEYDSLLNQLYHNLGTLENHLENVRHPPLESEFDDIPCLEETDIYENEECKYVFNLFAPMPTMETIDILF
ncbi:uncharacterized protein LOC108089121 isoform X2 [Drosophila ficusphila]|uniref:uncharacterized protein LOC108089121 isoform X2 n=1 Tax=Drosophila ficusphila TaxID=30025 RepID=UPI0007E76EDA|nr:uncharacterized protein LOC108089121 isoform X2 [Drosophila ficusphila]